MTKLLKPELFVKLPVTLLEDIQGSSSQLNHTYLATVYTHTGYSVTMVTLTPTLSPGVYGMSISPASVAAKLNVFEDGKMSLDIAPSMSRNR